MVLLAAWSIGAGAEGWNVTPRASISQTFTDNVNLSPPGEEEDEAITLVNVGVRTDRSAARLDLEAAYNLQYVTYWQDTNDDNAFHQFLGAGTFVVDPERFFIDGSAFYGQRFVNPRTAAGDNVIGSDDITDQYRYTISPYWVERYGTFAQSEVRYLYERIGYPSGDVSDVGSETNRWRASLQSGPQFGRVDWTLSYRLDEIDYDDDSSVTFESVEALAGVRITPQVRVFGAVGREENEWDRDDSRARPDDEFWRVGADWTPTPRTFIQGFTGQRFFGDWYGGSISHRLRRAELAADYTEEATTTQFVEFVPGVFQLVDDFGNPIVIDDEAVFLEFEFPDLVPDVYIRKRGNIRASGGGARTNWVLRGFDERREYQVNPVNEHVSGLSAAFGRRLTSDARADLNVFWEDFTTDDLADENQERYGVRSSLTWLVAPKTRANVRASWRRSDFEFDNRSQDLWATGAGLSVTLGRSASASVVYGYQQRDDNRRPDEEFRENRIVFTLSGTF
jgi:uncharacterized protein (PEP-CTERM system associated)